MSDTLFGQAAPGGSISSGAGNAGTNGLHFTVSAGCTLDGIWHYSPATSTQLPAEIGLYTTQASPSTGTLVHSEAASWSGAAGSGWVYAAFSSPPSLSPGTDYMAAQFRDDAVNEWFVFYTVAWPVTSGILTAPDDTGAGQGWYNTGTALAFPATQLAGDNFGMDVQVAASGFSAVGTIIAGDDVTPASWTPAAAGDFAVVFTASSGAAATALSSSNADWEVLEAGTLVGSEEFTAFKGTATAAEASDITVTVSGSPVLRVGGQAFSSTAGPAAVTVYASGTLNAKGTAWPSLTALAGQMYIGFEFNSVTATDGSTAGYAYQQDAHGNGLAYDLSTPAGATSPVWGDSNGRSVLALLLQESGTSLPPSRSESAAFVPLPPAVIPAASSVTAAYVPYAPVPLFSAGGRLNLYCELNLGGTWTDVSPCAYQRSGGQPPVRVTRGRPDESSQANPGSCRWEWDNRDGRFSPRNPLSPYYGSLKRNTPVRWSVPAASSYLRLEGAVGSCASCPDAAGLHVTGSLEVRIGLRLTDWRPCDLAGRYDGTANSSWIINTQDDGTLQFWWRDSGGTLWAATSTVPVPFTGGDFALRFTLDATSGTVTFYASDGIDGTWAQLGDPVSPTGGAATSVYAGSVELTAGYSVNNPSWQMLGRVYGLRLYDGIGGTVAADAAFSAQAPGAATWTDTAGNTWSLSGDAELSGRDYRFHGEMSSQPPRWDVTGRDMSVQAQAGGPLRRLGQGTANAMSAMKRAILLQSGDLAPVAYWPMEDAAGASVFGSAVAGAGPGTFDASPAPKLASDSSFTASAPLPSLGKSRVQFPVPAYAGTGTWTVRFLLKVSPPSAPATLVRVVTSPWAACPVLYVNVDGAGNLEFVGYAADGSEAFNSGYYSFGATSPLWCSVEAVPAPGGGVKYNLVTVAPGMSSGFQLPQTASGSPGTVSLVQLDPAGAFDGTVAGHMQVQSAWQSMFALGQPLNAWSGETAAARYARLAAENGYAVRILGSPGASAAMGPQGQGTLDALLKECEAADQGQQFEPRQQLALGYRTLASMCNQAPALTLDYAASEPGGVSGGAASGLAVTYDDRLTSNDWTVTRGAASGSQGATVQVQLDDGSAMSISDPPAGAGDYAKTQTVNVQYDSQLPDAAGWRVHIGTVDDERWPVIAVNLARPATAALARDALAVDAGDMVQVSSVPDTVTWDPARQLALGFKESLGGFHYTVEYSAVPEAPYEAMLLGDPVYGHADTDGSVLHSAAAYPQSSLEVDTASGFPLWSTDSADCPFDVAVAGMRLTVTAVSGSSSPQVLTVTPAVNGVQKDLPAGADVRLWFPPTLALA